GKGDAAAAALDALARIGNPGGAAVLTSQLTSKVAALRGIAVEGLARVGDAASLTSIRDATTAERSDGVLLAVAFASASLSNGSFDPIVEALAKPRLHDQAFQYLIELAPGHASSFARLLQDPDAHLRADGVNVFALARDASALPLVEPLPPD